MSQTTAITTSPDPKPGPHIGAEPSPALAEYHRTLWHKLRMILSPLSSLKVTVILFALSIFLVFFGTLAQMDQGIFTVLKSYFRSPIAWVPWQVFVRFGQVFLGVSPDASVAGHFPFPGGWLLGGVLLVNLLAAHLVRFKASWKRSGILILHAGVVVMMVSELVTGLFANEGRMSIDEGASTNYLEDFHDDELAFIDHANSQTDDVVVVPGKILRKRKLVRDGQLPFDVMLERYMVNSALVDVDKAPKDAQNLATTGLGLHGVAVEQAPVNGTGSAIDIPAAYVTLREKDSDRSLGTFLLTPWLPGHKRPQSVTVDGKTYDVALRFKRTYKPYSIHLIKFSFDRYQGTRIAKNYSSLVRVIDPEQNENREVLIRMNEPLRYRGDAFYQGSFDEETEKTTILQVVRNPGWLMPYISCGMVALGMLIHFGLHLHGFLRRRLTPNV